MFEYQKSSKLHISIPSTYYFIDTMIAILSYYQDDILFIIHEEDPLHTDSEQERILFRYLFLKYVQILNRIPTIKYSNSVKTLFDDQKSKVNEPIFRFIKLNESHKMMIEFPLNAFYNEFSLFNKCFPYYNTRIYAPGCMPEPSELYAFLVTGLGGAGTHYLTNILRSIDVDVLHETFGFYGSVGWMYSVNNAILGIPYPQHTHINFTVWEKRYQTSIQVVRCPMKQISAISAHSAQSFNFIYHHAVQSLDLVNTTKTVPRWLSYLDSRRDILLSLPYDCYGYNTSCYLPLAALSFVFWTKMVNETTMLGTHHIHNLQYLIEKLCDVSPLHLSIQKYYSNSQCSIFKNATIEQRYFMLNRASNRTAKVFELFYNRTIQHLIKRKYRAEKFHSLLPPKYEHHYLPLHDIDKIRKSFSMKLTDEDIENMTMTSWNRGYVFPTLSHKWHKKFTLDDLDEMNSILAKDVEDISKVLHFSNVNHC